MLKLSKFTLFFSAYLIISSFFMQEAWNIWKAIFGVKLLVLFLVILCLVAISAILYKNIKSGFNLKKMVLICVICIWGFIFAWRQPYLPEKAHVLQFGLLGWLTMQDLTGQKKTLLKSALLAFVFVAIIGSLEEGYQKFLPWRVCELRDIITDSLSGMLGICLNFLSQTGFSSFIRLL